MNTHQLRNSGRGREERRPRDTHDDERYRNDDSFAEEQERRNAYENDYYARADYDDYHDRQQYYRQPRSQGYYGDGHRYRREHHPAGDDGDWQRGDERDHPRRGEYRGTTGAGHYEPHRDYPPERGRVGTGYQDYSGGPRNKSAYGRSWDRGEEEGWNDARTWGDRRGGEDSMYDAGRREYDDTGYRHYGYQSSGETVGFGYRPSRRNHADWERESEYRGGHAFNRRGYGKHGAR